MLYSHEIKIKSLELTYSQVVDELVYLGLDKEDADNLVSKYGLENNLNEREYIPILCELSKKFPNVVFELYTRNLEVDEYYLTYVLGGKYQQEQGYITYDPMKEVYLRKFYEEDFN